MAGKGREDVSEELPRNQEQSGRTMGGRQAGGGPAASDNAAPGGSGGSGGYGDAQNQQLHQGQQDRTLSGGRSDDDLSRGDAQVSRAPHGSALSGGQGDQSMFDEQQGGGRGADAVSEFQRDQAAHQDRGQSAVEEEADRD